MIKDIRYGGVSAVPSAYDSPDGDLDLSLNMIHEDGSLRPIDTPAPVMRLDPNMRVAFIHTTSGYTHYIVRDLSSPQLFWIDPSEIDSETLRPIIPRLIGSLPSGVVRQVTAMGNTLIVLTPSGMFYFLWQDDTKAYAALGSRIPFPEISFALGVPEVDEPPSFNVTLSIPDSLKSYVQNTWNPGSGLSGGRRPVGPAARYQSAELSALIQAASNAVYAGLNAFLAESADNGRFTEPFFIRYALRMFDGSHTMHSAPVLMIPNSAAPRLPYIVASDSDGSFSANTRIYHKACSLFFRILSDSISQWSDIITHIDFYVTPPIYTFDQSGTVDPCHADHSASGGFSHFGVYSSGNSSSGASGPGNTDPGDSGSGDSGSGDSGSESGDSGGSDTPKDPFNYHRKPVNPVADASYTFPDGNMERKLSQGSTMVWNISSRKASVIEDDILSPSASLFYLVSSVELAKVAPMTAFSYLPIEERSLANLPVRPRLEDDYQSHHSIIPSTAYPFNSRLNIAGVSISPFPGFPLHSMAQCCIPAEGSIQVSLTFHVRLRRSGMSLWTTLPSGSDTFPKAWLDSFFPRFLFYPDSSAVEMVIELIADGAPSGYWTLPLSPIRPSKAPIGSAVSENPCPSSPPANGTKKSPTMPFSLCHQRSTPPRSTIRSSSLCPELTPLVPERSWPCAPPQKPSRRGSSDNSRSTPSHPTESGPCGSTPTAHIQAFSPSPVKYASPRKESRSSTTPSSSHPRAASCSWQGPRFSVYPIPSPPIFPSIQYTYPHLPASSTFSSSPFPTMRNPPPIMASMN